MELIVKDKNGKVVSPGDTVTDFRGDSTTLVRAISAPVPGKNGKVEVPRGIFYMTVFDLTVETAVKGEWRKGMTDMLKTKWEYDDGGRKSSGRRGLTGDCVVRSIAIAMERDYAEVYDELFAAQRQWYLTSRHRVARKSRARGSEAADSSPRTGVTTPVAREYINSTGWVWTPTMSIGSGCRVHLRGDELPSGRIIARVSKHFCAVVDGVVHDTYNPARDGTRCVYGYWSEE